MSKQSLGSTATIELASNGECLHVALARAVLRLLRDRSALLEVDMRIALLGVTMSSDYWFFEFLM